MKKRIISISMLIVFIICMLPVFSSAAIQGDVNGDGKVAAVDARLALRNSVGLEKFDKNKTARADMNGDGKITAADARSILRKSVGLIDDAPSSSSNQYEIVRSKNFYIKGQISTNEKNYDSCVMAVTSKTVYMTSDFEGAEMGMLVDDGDIYMIYPAKKSALLMSDTVLAMAGLSSDDLLGESDIDFSSMPEFSKLRKLRTEKFRGTSCTVYSYTDADGVTEVYMSGDKLIRLVSLDRTGKYLSDTVIEKITSTVPAECKSVPKGYKIYKGLTGMYSFMNLIEDVI